MQAATVQSFTDTDEAALFDPPDDDDDPLGVAATDPPDEDERAIDLAVEGVVIAPHSLTHSAEPALVLEDEPPPFDPPQEDDEAFGPPTLARTELAHIIAEAALAAQASKLERAAERMRTGSAAMSTASASAAEAPPPIQPLPNLNVYAAWDRSDMREVFARCADHPRMARTRVAVERGGLEGAATRLRNEARQDIVIVDTTLSAAGILSAAPRLVAAAGAEAKIVVIGAVNDIAFLRALDALGVSLYLLAPVSTEVLVEALCTLSAGADSSRLIAVVGARGGVGASTLAYNLAWSIAERQHIGAALVDFDIAFGAAVPTASSQMATVPLSEALESGDDATLDKAFCARGERLRVLAAPGALDGVANFECAEVESFLQRLRQISPIVVLDVPHAWNAWTKQLLTVVDEVVLVAGPDLASLRNADNMLKQLRPLRVSEPLVALSMVGVPKRPEIRMKDVVDTLGAEPIASIAFEPELFGMAAVHGRAVCEIAPGSALARELDLFATGLTGKSPVRRSKLRPLAKTVVQPLRVVERPLELTQRAVAIPPRERNLMDKRQAALGAFAEAGAPRKAARKPRRGLVRRVVGLSVLIAMLAWVAQQQQYASIDEPAAFQYRA